MTARSVTGDKIAGTSSKGNQEKWYDAAEGSWLKLDQYGYEALTETLISVLLEKSNIEADSGFNFVRYNMQKLSVRGRGRNGCVSRNFLRQGQSLITVNRLLSNCLGVPLAQKLARMQSDKKRIAYLAESVAELTGLKEFPRYLTFLFEVDALFCNDDRHLNNIAVIEQEGAYSYCPIFDNAAGLLSNTQISQMDIAPKALIAELRAKPFNTTFTRQMNSARGLYGKQLIMPKLNRTDIYDAMQQLLEYYPARDRGIIADRVSVCILLRQKNL